MNKYYLVRKDGSLKYERFVMAETQEAAETQWGANYYIFNTEPPEFSFPYCPYWRNNAWVLKKGPQIYYSLSGAPGGQTSISVGENAVYEITGSCKDLELVIPSAYLKESSVFFTLSDASPHLVTFRAGEGNTGDIHLVGSTTYWEDGKSYVLTVYNNYIIIGVAKINV